MHIVIILCVQWQVLVLPDSMVAFSETWIFLIKIASLYWFQMKENFDSSIAEP